MLSNLMFWLHFRFQELRDSERGAAAVEYGLLVGLIAVAIIAVVFALGGKLKSMFNAVCIALPAVGDCSATPPTGGGGS